MQGLYFALRVLGALCFVVGAAGWTGFRQRSGGIRSVALLPLGLFFWILVPVIQSAQTLFK